MREWDIDFRALRDMSEDETRKMTAELQEKVAKIDKEATDGVLNALSSKQAQRFKELRFQSSVTTPGRAAYALRSAGIDLSDHPSPADAEEFVAALPERVEPADTKVTVAVSETQNGL